MSAVLDSCSALQELILTENSLTVINAFGFCIWVDCDMPLVAFVLLGARKQTSPHLTTIFSSYVFPLFFSPTSIPPSHFFCFPVI